MRSLFQGCWPRDGRRALIMVDLPAPLGPMTATRELSEQKMDTSSSVFRAAVGYLRARVTALTHCAL